MGFAYFSASRSWKGSILRETDADEIMVNGQIFDHQARLHSFELAMDVKEELLG